MRSIFLVILLGLTIGWSAAQAVETHPEGQRMERYNKIEPGFAVGEVSPRFELASYFPESGEPPKGLKGKIEQWLMEHPFFKRHPHPMVVHFPIALLLLTALLEVLALATLSPRMELTAYHCLFIGMLAVPVAIMTGYFTWWINYGALETQAIFLKRFLAWVALALSVFAVLLRSFVIEEPLRKGNVYVTIYVITLLVLAGVISGVGFLGGSIAFPY